MINDKEMAMKQFRFAVVPAVQKGGVEEAENKILFLALNDGIFIVGKSPTHVQLWRDYGRTRNKRMDVAPELFAAGSCEGGCLDFRCTAFVHVTPGWKQEQVVQFLAGQALDLALAYEEHAQQVVSALSRIGEE